MEPHVLSASPGDGLNDKNGRRIQENRQRRKKTEKKISNGVLKCGPWSLEAEGAERLFVFQRVAGDDLLDGHVRAGEEADQPDDADGRVLHAHRRQQRALRVEGQSLEDGREDQRQEAAADRAHQRDDQVQLRDQDGEGAWEGGGGGDTWKIFEWLNTKVHEAGKTLNFTPINRETAAARRRLKEEEEEEGKRKKKVVVEEEGSRRRRR